MSESLPMRRPIGDQLRAWREQRRLSQMELALQTDISARHLSFVETGRSKPSREMIMRLCEQLELPLRERNQLLLAGGYAPVYAESALDAPDLGAVRAAIRQLLSGHEPYPAVVVDRAWNLVDANAGVALLTEGSAPWLLEPPANALRLSLHPDGMAPRIANLGEWRANLLSRVRREVAMTRDAALTSLYKELQGYHSYQPEPEPHSDADIVVPLRIWYRNRELSFFSMSATFGAPLNVTVSELAIESFYPADPATTRFLLARAERSQDPEGAEVSQEP
jgi:transcriptional regulator with XRE-family HTH domain